MSKRTFTQEQIASLLQNKNVARCSEKSITYHKVFKLATVKRYQEGLPPSVIFREAGLNPALVGRETPKCCLKRWRKIYSVKGTVGLQNDGRGIHSAGRPRGIKHMDEKEKLKYLEAQVAYLKAENAFLAKLRKQRLNYGHHTSSILSDR